jgi:undecaprenyl-diphosphatase
MRRAEGPRPRLRHALALGLLQGPSELLPISSSAHTILVPFLAGWPYAELDPELRKSFEVALHAGAGIALAIEMRSDLIAQASKLNRRRGTVLALSLAPPAVVGYLLEGPIERRLSGPRSSAAALFAGAVVMAIADRRGGARSMRKRDDAHAGDGLALGVAQTLALIPGVSRNGATLTAARARGFGRGDAQALSWDVGLGVILGASALKGGRLLRRGAPAGATRALATGGGAAFLSTIASARLLRRARLAQRSLLPYALYRCLLAAGVARRLREAHNRDG